MFEGKNVFETNSSSTHSLTIRKMSKNENNIIDDDASFEIQRGMEVGRDFEKVFHKKIEIL